MGQLNDRTNRYADQLYVQKEGNKLAKKRREEDAEQKMLWGLLLILGAVPLVLTYLKYITMNIKGYIVAILLVVVGLWGLAKFQRKKQER